MLNRIFDKGETLKNQVKKIIGKKKIATDMLLNIIATAIPTITLQLLILPRLARYMSDEKYGLLVTVLAILNVVPSTMGNTLNNIRLIYGGECVEGKAEDYNVILLILAILNLCVVGLFSWIYEKTITFTSLLLTLIASTLWLCREYYIVTFRIKINYVFIVISNILMVIGYAIGFEIFKIKGHWQYIYIFGNLLCLIFITCKSNLYREPIKISKEFKRISWQTALLFFSNILTRITTYADKLLIFPILGGATVSVYYAATLFGKVVSLAIMPVSSVMLSYLSKEKVKDDDAFKKTFVSSAIVCLVGYLGCLLISRPVLSMIYPQFVDEAMQYVIWTTGTVVISALISVLNPFVLKFFDMKWQMAINGGAAITYIILSMGLLSVWGLTGFCIGALLTNILKLGLMIFIYEKCKARP